MGLLAILLSTVALGGPLSCAAPTVDLFNGYAPRTGRIGGQLESTSFELRTVHVVRLD